VHRNVTQRRSRKHLRIATFSAGNVGRERRALNTWRRATAREPSVESFTRRSPASVAAARDGRGDVPDSETFTGC
jgi:hypothetical protein